MSQSLTSQYLTITEEAVWSKNVSFVQLIGLCPLMAVTGTVINGLGLGIATMLTLIATNMVISMMRGVIPNEVRLPVFVILIAAVVTVIEVLTKAFYYDLYLVLGIYIPLIVTNCAVIGRAEAFAFKHSVDKAMLDGFVTGLGFTVALVLLGGLRELIGYGTLFSQAELMFGEAARHLTLTVFEHYRGFLLAILPPGAFFGLALLIAAKNWLQLRHPENV